MTRNKFALILFSATTSALMSAVVSGVMTYEVIGFSPSFQNAWLSGWFASWPVAFIVLLLAGPLVRKYVYQVCNCSDAYAPAAAHQATEDQA